MKLIIDTEVIKDLIEYEWGYEGIRDDLDELFEKHGTPLDTLKAEKELDEVIERFSHNAEYERTHGNLQGCLEFRQLAEWLKDYKRLLEQEPYDFARWVASEIFDDMWEYNKDAFAEIACRKLAKLGIVRAKGNEWELVEPQERTDKE